LPNLGQYKAIDDLREEADVIDIMLSSLVDVLEEKRVLGHSGLKKRIKQRLRSK
jgi:hypothetical protein